MRVIFALSFLLIINQLFAWQDYEQQLRKQPIKLVASAHLEKQKEPSLTETNIVAKKLPGQVIYEQYCMTCHQAGIAGAPKFRDAQTWQSRLAQKNLQQLTSAAINGLNAMPLKGTCQTCSKQDIKEAIQYMLPN